MAVFHLKKQFILSFIAFSSLVFAQKADIIITYQYKLVQDQTWKAFAVADEKESFFFFTQKAEETYETLQADQFKKVNQYYIFQTNNERSCVYQTINIFDYKKTKLPDLAKDCFEKPEWKIMPDKKKILNYNCQLATTIFRGVEHKVWFTTEISQNIYPWKLDGLPGAILKFENSTGIMIGEATEVLINPNLEMPKKFITFFNENKNAAMHYKDFIALHNQNIEAWRAQSMANAPKGTKFLQTPTRSGQIEQTFEWETK